MNSRERIMAVLAGEKPDMTPIFPKIAFANVLACEGMTVREYMTDPKLSLIHIWCCWGKQPGIKWEKRSKSWPWRLHCFSGSRWSNRIWNYHKRAEPQSGVLPVK